VPAAFRAETKEKAKKKTEQQAGGKKRKATDKAEGAAGEWGQGGRVACWLMSGWAAHCLEVTAVERDGGVPAFSDPVCCITATADCLTGATLLQTRRQRRQQRRASSSKSSSNQMWERQRQQPPERHHEAPIGYEL
jgi:hypothetical protein